MRLGLEDPICSQHGFMEVRRNDWKMPEGGPARPMPFAVVEVSGHGAEGRTEVSTAQRAFGHVLEAAILRIAVRAASR